MNIVNMAMSYLGPTIVNKIASSLGINNTIVNGLISAALPSLLGGLTGSSRSGSGAGALFDAVKDMAWGGSDENVLESALDGGNVADFTKGGGSMLGGLLGGNMMDGLAGALGRSQGVTQDQAGSLLGMLGPVVLGSLKDRVQSDGLDAAGLAGFLNDQKGNIAQAMPANFAERPSGRWSDGRLRRCVRLAHRWARRCCLRRSWRGHRRSRRRDRCCCRRCGYGRRCGARCGQYGRRRGAWCG